MSRDIADSYLSVRKQRRIEEKVGGECWQVAFEVRFASWMHFFATGPRGTYCTSKNADALTH